MRNIKETETHWKCRKCGAKHSNPWADCDLLDDTECGKNFGNRGFQGWIE